MTLNSAALSIDGARIPSSLLRLGNYASFGDAQGVIGSGDLKVTQLAVAGVGVKIAGGGGVVLNRYQASPTQSYVVENLGDHIIPPGAMPAANASVRYFIVGIAIGDPDFSQTGHPFMGSDDPPQGQEETFQYVRPVVIQAATATSTDFSMTQGAGFPALPLARLAIPANTTTITDAMITDLRTLARPKSKLEIGMVTGGAATLTAIYPTMQRFPNVPVLSVLVPPWAKTAKVMGFVEGVRQLAAARAVFRPYVEGTSLVGSETNAYEDVGSVQDRHSYNLGGVIDVSSVAGQVKSFSVQAGAITGFASKFATDSATTAMLQVNFEQGPA